MPVSEVATSNVTTTTDITTIASQSLYNSVSEIDVMDLGLNATAATPSVIVNENENEHRNSSDTSSNRIRDSCVEGGGGVVVHDNNGNNNNNNDVNVVVSEVNDNVMIFSDEFNLNYFDLTKSTTTSSPSNASAFLSTTQTTNTPNVTTS